MLQLVNLSNDISDVRMIKNDAGILEKLFDGEEKYQTFNKSLNIPYGYPVL